MQIKLRLPRALLPSKEDTDPPPVEEEGSSHSEETLEIESGQDELDFEHHYGMDLSEVESIDEFLPRKLTARQQAMLDPASPSPVVGVSRQRELSEDQVLRKLELSKRQRDLRERRLQDHKHQTIQKLLTKKETGSGQSVLRRFLPPSPLISLVPRSSFRLVQSIATDGKVQSLLYIPRTMD
jgi:hypothetical protein